MFRRFYRHSHLESRHCDGCVGVYFGRMNGPFSGFAIGQAVAISNRMRALSGGVAVTRADICIVLSLSETLRTVGGSEQDECR